MSIYIRSTQRYAGAIGITLSSLGWLSTTCSKLRNVRIASDQAHEAETNVAVMEMIALELKKSIYQQQTRVERKRDRPWCISQENVAEEEQKLDILEKMTEDLEEQIVEERFRHERLVQTEASRRDELGYLQNGQSKILHTVLEWLVKKGQSQTMQLNRSKRSETHIVRDNLRVVYRITDRDDCDDHDNCDKPEFKLYL